jgi:hypothetical protein
MRWKRLMKQQKQQQQFVLSATGSNNSQHLRARRVLGRRGIPQFDHAVGGGTPTTSHGSAGEVGALSSISPPRHESRRTAAADEHSRRRILNGVGATTTIDGTTSAGERSRHRGIAAFAIVFDAACQVAAVHNDRRATVSDGLVPG